MEKIVEVKDLCKTFINNNNQVHILKNINFFISKGDFVAVMGPSGSGKSTLLHNISGIDLPTSGMVYFDSSRIDILDEVILSELRLNNMGFVFQQINLLKNLGILDNIILPAYMANKRNRKDINEEAINLMKKTGIINLATNDITQASGGELQRVAICRALINNPKIIFADEPTGALNSRNANEIIKIFKAINQEGTTIMLVTHDIKVAANCNRVLYMQDGIIEGEYNFRKNNSDERINSRENSLSNWLMKKGW